MREPAKRAAYLALLTALGTVLLLFANAVPAGRLGSLLLASFPVCCALMLCGPWWAAAVFALTALLGFLLFPGAAVMGYAVFFGYYPIVKSLAERIRSVWVSRGLKLLLYTAAFVLYWLLARALFPGAAALPWYALYPLGAAVFFLYDWCYSIVIRFFIDKIARYIP